MSSFCLFLQDNGSSDYRIDRPTSDGKNAFTVLQIIESKICIDFSQILTNVLQKLKGILFIGTQCTSCIFRVYEYTHQLLYSTKYSSSTMSDRRSPTYGV